MHCWCFNLSWVIYLISEFIGLLLIHSQLYCREWLTKVPLNQLTSQMLFTSQFYRLSTWCTVAHHLILDVMDFSSGDCSKSSDSTWSNMKTYASICFFQKKKKKNVFRWTERFWQFIKIKDSYFVGRLGMLVSLFSLKVPVFYFLSRMLTHRAHGIDNVSHS